LVSAAPFAQYTNVLEAFDLVIDFDAPSGAVIPLMDVTATSGADGRYGFTGLAAFVLNVMQGKYADGTALAKNGVTLTAPQFLAEATAVLALDPYTVGNDPNRRSHREWVDRLEDYNRGKTDGEGNDCD
jgi:hypothetical protein